MSKTLCSYVNLNEIENQPCDSSRRALYNPEKDYLTVLEFGIESDNVRNFDNFIRFVKEYSPEDSNQGKIVRDNFKEQLIYDTGQSPDHRIDLRSLYTLFSAAKTFALKDLDKIGHLQKQADELYIIQITDEVANTGEASVSSEIDQLVGRINSSAIDRAKTEMNEVADTFFFEKKNNPNNVDPATNKDFLIHVNVFKVLPSVVPGIRDLSSVDKEEYCINSSEGMAVCRARIQFVEQTGTFEHFKIDRLFYILKAPSGETIAESRLEIKSDGAQKFAEVEIRVPSDKYADKQLQCKIEYRFQFLNNYMAHFFVNYSDTIEFTPSLVKKLHNWPWTTELDENLMKKYNVDTLEEAEAIWKEKMHQRNIAVLIFISSIAVLLFLLILNLKMPPFLISACLNTDSFPARRGNCNYDVLRDFTLDSRMITPVHVGSLEVHLARTKFFFMIPGFRMFEKLANHRFTPKTISFVINKDTGNNARFEIDPELPLFFFKLDENGTEIAPSPNGNNTDNHRMTFEFNEPVDGNIKLNVYANPNAIKEGTIVDGRNRNPQLELTVDIETEMALMGEGTQEAAKEKTAPSGPSLEETLIEDASSIDKEETDPGRKDIVVSFRLGSANVEEEQKRIRIEFPSDLSAEARYAEEIAHLNDRTTQATLVIKNGDRNALEPYSQKFVIGIRKRAEPNNLKYFGIYAPEKFDSIYAKTVKTSLNNQVDESLQERLIGIEVMNLPGDEYEKIPLALDFGIIPQPDNINPGEFEDYEILFIKLDSKYRPLSENNVVLKQSIAVQSSKKNAALEISAFDSQDTQVIPIKNNRGRNSYSYTSRANDAFQNLCVGSFNLVNTARILDGDGIEDQLFVSVQYDDEHPLTILHGQLCVRDDKGNEIEFDKHWFKDKTNLESPNNKILEKLIFFMSERGEIGNENVRNNDNHPFFLRDRFPMLDGQHGIPIRNYHKLMILFDGEKIVRRSENIVFRFRFKITWWTSRNPSKRPQDVEINIMISQEYKSRFLGVDFGTSAIVVQAYEWETPNQAHHRDLIAAPQPVNLLSNFQNNDDCDFQDPPYMVSRTMLVSGEVAGEPDFVKIGITLDRNQNHCWKILPPVKFLAGLRTVQNQNGFFEYKPQNYNPEAEYTERARNIFLYRLPDNSINERKPPEVPIVIQSIYSKLLILVKKALEMETAYPGFYDKVKKLIITTPHTFTSTHLSVIEEVIQKELPYISIDFIGEPEAVACYYINNQNIGIPEQYITSKENRIEYVLVCDMGAGTFDLCYMRIERNVHGELVSLETRNVMGCPLAGNYIDTMLAATLHDKLATISDRAYQIIQSTGNSSQLTDEEKHIYNKKLRIIKPVVPKVHENSNHDEYSVVLNYSWRMFQLKKLLGTEGAEGAPPLKIWYSMHSRGDDRAQAEYSINLETYQLVPVNFNQPLANVGILDAVSDGLEHVQDFDFEATLLTIRPEEIRNSKHIQKTLVEIGDTVSKFLGNISTPDGEKEDLVNFNNLTPNSPVPLNTVLLSGRGLEFPGVKDEIKKAIKKTVFKNSSVDDNRLNFIDFREITQDVVEQKNAVSKGALYYGQIYSDEVPFRTGNSFTTIGLLYTIGSSIHYKEVFSKNFRPDYINIGENKVIAEYDKSVTIENARQIRSLKIVKSHMPLSEKVTFDEYSDCIELGEIKGYGKDDKLRVRLYFTERDPVTVRLNGKEIELLRPDEVMSPDSKLSHWPHVFMEEKFFS